jgi:hypothetical protein
MTMGAVHNEVRALPSSQSELLLTEVLLLNICSSEANNAGLLLSEKIQSRQAGFCYSEMPTLSDLILIHAQSIMHCAEASAGQIGNIMLLVV